MLTTPKRLKKNQEDSTNSKTISNQNQTSRKKYNTIDYKNKMIQLMDENVELKVSEKKYISHIQSLQNKYQQIQNQVSYFLKKTNFTTLTQAILNYSTLPQTPQIHPLQPTVKQLIYQYQQFATTQKILQLTHEQYSTSITKKLQQFYKKNEKNTSNLREQNQKLKHQLKKLQKQNDQLKQRNKKLLKNNQKLQQQLKGSISRYQQISDVIQQKLKYYINKVKYYQEIMRNNGTQMHDFSFGKDSQDENNNKQYLFNKEQKRQNSHQRQQPNSPKNNNTIFDDEMTGECYRASIDGLLQQNKRLKKSFQSLYKLKQGQEIPEQLKKQINIMKSILQLNQNIQTIDY